MDVARDFTLAVVGWNSNDLSDAIICVEWLMEVRSLHAFTIKDNGLAENRITNLLEVVSVTSLIVKDRTRLSRYTFKDKTRERAEE
jgi:hypothetical protein